MRKIDFLRFLFVVIAFTMTTMLFAQQKLTVSGKVVDSSGEPLPGVNIIIKGTTNGVVSDMDGNYQLVIENAENAVLQFNFIGFNDVEVQVAGQKTINVTLEESTIGLDEVVAIGYGTTTRRDLTGAVSSVKTEELKQSPVANVAQALQGKLSGVAVSMQDGRPGADVKIRIRGGGSVTQDNSPLVVVDGIQGVNLSEIPADQIESIDVLKDAASTAIYGTNGANGVILVTTKGFNVPKGKTQVSYSGFLQYKEVAETLDILNTEEYLLHQWSYMTAMGYGDDFADYYGLGSTNTNFYDQSGIDAWNAYADVPIHDYTQDLLRNTWSQDHNISISNNTEKTSIAFNANMTEDNGIKIKSGFKRYNVALKLEQELWKDVKFGINMQYIETSTEGNESVTNGSGSVLSSAYRFKPIDYPFISQSLIPAGAEEYTLEELFDENLVTIPVGFGNGDVNVDPTYDPYIETSTTENIRNLQRFRGVAYLNWDIIKGLTLRTEFGGHRRYNENNYYEEGIALPDANGYISDRLGRVDLQRRAGYRSTTTINWELQGLGNHKVSLLAGMEFTKSRTNTSRVQGRGYPSNFDYVTTLAKMQFAQLYTIVEDTGSGDQIHQLRKDGFDFYNKIGVASTKNSYFGRFNYGFKGRYLFTATMRADGSSNFAPNHSWGYFPSSALAWRISDEPFMGGTQAWLDNLKLRLSIGSAGSDQIPYNAWNNLYDLEFDDVGNITYETKGLFPNPDLKWETTVSRNIGLDFNLFNNRIYGSVEGYSNFTKDLLGKRKLSGPWPEKYENIGRTTNKGIEVSFGADIVRQKDLNISFNATYNYNVNKIDKLISGVNTDYGTDWNSTSTYPRNEYMFQEGAVVGTVVGFISDGYYTPDDFNYDDVTGQYTLKEDQPYYENFNYIGNYPNPFDVVRIDTAGVAQDISSQMFPGAVKIKDTNGDDKITLDDATIIGEMVPRHTGGFSLNASYKGFDLTTSFTYALGGHVYNIAKILNTTGRKDYTFGSNSMGFIRDSYKYYDIDDAGDLVTVTDPESLNALNGNAKYHTPYHELGLVLSDYIEKSDFLRLNTLTVGYTIPKNVTQKIGIDRFRVYFTGGNLLTITGYSGLDPEVGTDDSKNGDYPTPGLDFGSYPRAKTYTFGVNIDF